MPPKSTTAEKKPSSTAGKAPAKAPESAAKTAKKAAPAADGEKKKKRTKRRETYTSYIYKGTLLSNLRLKLVLSCAAQS
jgi:histone H2B